MALLQITVMGPWDGASPAVLHPLPVSFPTAFILPKAEVCVRNHVQPYLPSILEALMVPTSQGFTEVRDVLFKEVTDMNLNIINEGGIDKLGEVRLVGLVARCSRGAIPKNRADRRGRFIPRCLGCLDGSWTFTWNPAPTIAVVAFEDQRGRRTVLGSELAEMGSGRATCWLQVSQPPRRAGRGQEGALRDALALPSCSGGSVCPAVHGEAVPAGLPPAQDAELLREDGAAAAGRAAAAL